MCSSFRTATFLMSAMKALKSGPVAWASAHVSRVCGALVENVVSSEAEEEEPGSDVPGARGVVSWARDSSG
jgi:hypothetical protein